MIDRSILRNVWLLAACQGMLLCNGVTLIAVNGLVGRQLAPSPTLATLTITGYVIGAALMTLPASQFMRRFGRRAGFMLGAVLGICGGLLCAYAVHVGSFWLLCLGTFTSGSYNAFGLQYRFAAADMAPPTGNRRPSPTPWPAASSAASSDRPSATSPATPGTPSSWPPTHPCRPSRWSRC
jgi:MFS family permease